MERLRSNCYIGTSGWIYSDWEKRFYPEHLLSSDKLKFYSQHFNTVEINSSFYHLPRPSTFKNWYSQTPEDFIFSLKVSRYITHIKRMVDVDDAWRRLYQNATLLKEKLGPFLFQFPPSFKKTEENIRRLETFLSKIRDLRIKIAFEFRHKTWIDKKIYSLFGKFNVSWVIANSSRYPSDVVSTADFVYFRFHGPKNLFSSSYSVSQLRRWAQVMKKFIIEDKKAIYGYFNNDFHAFAVFNAKRVKNFLSC